MAIWREKLDIKQFLGGDPLDDHEELPQEIREGVANELRKSRLLPVKELLQDLEQQVFTVGDFDRWLSDVYDYADARRVWLGL